MGLWDVGTSAYKGLLFQTPLMCGLILFFTALVGLCMGSFLNCTAWRIVHGESVLKGRSHCTSCGHPLGFLDLIPVLSYLLLKGHCRYCGEKFSGRYIGAEVVTAVAYVSVVLFFDISWLTLQYLILASVLLCISFADLEDYLVPDRLIIIGIVTRIVFVVALSENIWQGLLDMIIGGLSVAVPLIIIVLLADKLMGRDTMGGGDIKLIFMIGLYFSWQNSLLMMIVACVLGILFAVLSGRTGGISKWEEITPEEIEKAVSAENGEEAPELPPETVAALEQAKEDAKKEEKSAEHHPIDSLKDRERREAETIRENHLIPFGPAIAAGAWIVAIFGDKIVAWYMSFFA